MLCCGAAWVGMKNREEREELARVAAFADLFGQVGGRIESLCLPLDEILSSLPPLLEACGMSEGTASSLRAAMARVRDREAADTLARAADGLGRGTSGEQVRLCRAAAEELARCRDRMTAAALNNARARWTLMLSAVLGVMILFW